MQNNATCMKHGPMVAWPPSSDLRSTLSRGRGLQLLRALQAVEFSRAHILISPVRFLCLTFGYLSPREKNMHNRQKLPATRTAPQLSAAAPSSTGDLCLPVAFCRHCGCRPNRKAPPPPMAVSQPPVCALPVCLLPPCRPPVTAVSSSPSADTRPRLPPTPAACYHQAHVTETATGGSRTACGLRFVGVAVGWWSARASVGRCLHLSSFSRVCIRDGLWVRLCVLDVIWSGAVDRMKTRRPPVSLAVLSERVL